MLNEPEGRRYISHTDGVIFQKRSEITNVELFRYLLNYNRLTGFKSYFSHFYLLAKFSNLANKSSVLSEAEFPSCCDRKYNYSAFFFPLHIHFGGRFPGLRHFKRPLSANPPCATKKRSLADYSVEQNGERVETNVEEGPPKALPFSVFRRSWERCSGSTLWSPAAVASFNEWHNIFQKQLLTQYPCSWHDGMP